MNKNIKREVVVSLIFFIMTIFLPAPSLSKTKGGDKKIDWSNTVVGIAVNIPFNAGLEAQKLLMEKGAQFPGTDRPCEMQDKNLKVLICISVRYAKGPAPSEASSVSGSGRSGSASASNNGSGITCEATVYATLVKFDDEHRNVVESSVIAWAVGQAFAGQQSNYTGTSGRGWSGSSSLSGTNPENNAMAEALDNAIKALATGKHGFFGPHANLSVMPNANEMVRKAFSRKD